MAGSGIVAIIVVILVVVLAILLRKKFFVLLLDLALGTIVYLSAIFIISWMGIRIPLAMAEWGYPILLVIFILYHVFSNLTITRSSTKPWGTL